MYYLLYFLYIFWKKIVDCLLGLRAVVMLLYAKSTTLGAKQKGLLQSGKTIWFHRAVSCSKQRRQSTSAPYPMLPASNYDILRRAAFLKPGSEHCAKALAAVAHGRWLLPRPPRLAQPWWIWAWPSPLPPCQSALWFWLISPTVFSNQRVDQCFFFLSFFVPVVFHCTLILEDMQWWLRRGGRGVMYCAPRRQ